MSEIEYDESFTSRHREVKINIRVPESLRWRIQRKARANGLSMNKEIWATLEERYPQPIFDTAGILDLIEYIDGAEDEETFYSRIDECNEMFVTAKSPFRARPGKDRSIIFEHSPIG